MSVSPFLTGNSIWSTNAPQTSANNNHSSLEAGSSVSTSERTDTSRSGAHPLPNKPGAPARSNSAILPRSNGNVANDANRSVDSAFSNAGLRPGVIGATRGGSGAGNAGHKQPEIARSNSLATSAQTFRSASSGSPLPAAFHSQSGGPQPLRSPSFQENGMTLHDRGNNTSGEQELGTPRLFLDAQHTFNQNEQAAAPSFGHASGSGPTAPSTSGSGKTRPSSWMHPSSHDLPTDSMPVLSRDASSAAFVRPASSQGNHTTFSLSQGSSNLPSKRASSAQFGHATMDASLKNAFDAAGSANSGLLGQASNPTSPGIASGSLGRNSRIDRPAALGRATPTLAVPSYMNLSGGLLSPTAATIGSAAPSTVHSPIGSPLTGTGFHNPLPNRSVSAGHIFDRPVASSDEAGLESAVIKDMLDRLIRVESGMKDFSRQISGISRNVSLLLERTKGLPPSSLSSSGSANTAQNAAATANGGSAEDMRALNAQVSALASSVSHLLTLQNNGLGSAGMSSAPALTGLGLGPTGGMLGTPQLGGLDRATSPRVGSHPNGQFATGPNGPFPPSIALSPRPSISRNGRGWSGPSVRGQEQGADRRWNAPGQAGANNRKDGLTGGGGANAGNPPTPSLEDGTAATSSLMQPGTGLIQPNAIISKWEHLNLHPDLLRSILKYGLGPPNRIQQRALPFLLRGSDIIAQAPPTQERIASYVIPALQLVLNVLKETGGPGQTASNRGPVALIVSTTVDQATQAQRMALGLGAPLGIRVHMVTASSVDVHQEAQSLVQVWPHIVVGTPQKMSELFTYMTNNASSLHIQGNGPAAAAIKPSEVRLVVLDEVDQLIARNLADHVSTMLRVLPLPSAPANALVHARGAGGLSPGLPQSAGIAAFSPFDQGPDSLGNSPPSSSTMDRQVALFSNTVPQDVLNFAQSIHLRESVRVLVRRDGAGGGGGGSSMTQGASGGASMTGGSNSPGSNMQSSASQRDVSQPTNALGAHPMNSSVSATKDPVLAALKGMRQYYLYVAVTSNGGATSPIPGLPHNPAGEMKLDLISDLLEDIDFGQTVIYCANIATQEALIYKLSSKGIEAMGLNRDMNAYTRQQTLGKFRSPSSQFAGGRTRKALVVCEIAVNPKEVHQIPLIVFYDMPRSVEDYKDKVSCAAAGAMARPSVCVNVVTASGGPRGDVEMLRTIECHFGCKMAELPMDPRQILNF